MVGSAVPVSKYQIEIMYWYRDRRSGSAECTVEVIRIKKRFQLSEIRIIRIHRERELKTMWMTDQECRASVHGGGGGPNTFLSCNLIADSCRHTHTHTPDHLQQGAWHYMYFVLQAWKNAFIVSE